MHFVLAFVLLFILAAGIGLAAASSSTAVGAIDPACRASLTAGCQAVDPASPAKQAGSAPGTRSSPSRARRCATGPRWARPPQPAGRHAGRGHRAARRPAADRCTLRWPSSTVVRGRTWASRRWSCSSGPGRWAPSATRAASSARPWPGRPGWWRACPRRSRICSPRTAATTPAGRSQRGRRRGHHRPGGRRPDRLAGQGRRGAAAHRLAEHLRRRVQPAPPAARWTAATWPS